MYSTIITWFPNTPIDVAVDTSEGPNHSEAILGGISKIKDWAHAAIVCPLKYQYI